MLSGFLITGLLRAEWERRGGIDFGRFYARRARRLLPAILLLVTALAVYVSRRGDVTDLAGLKRDVVATLGYVANWRFVAAGQSYFDQFTDPSPLRHAWSLAIEEQYYLIWPLLLLGLYKLTRGNRRAVLVATLALAALSAVAMAALFTPGGDPSRVYYGTDTRAFELLAGSALALLVAGRTRRVPDAVGLVALVVLLAGWLTVGDDVEWMYRGGFVLATILGAVVIAAVARTADDAGPLARALSVAPLRGLGRISYGVYLWHWPVIVLLRPPTVDVAGDALRVLQVAVTLAASILSYVLVEQPVRTNAWAWLRGRTAAIAAPSVAVVLAVTVLVAGSTPASSPPSAIAAAAAAASTPPEIDVPPLSLVASRTPTADDPLRVLLVGDSVMADAEPGIEAALEATGVVDVKPGAAAGFGLTFTRTWRADWSSLVAQYRPDVVVSWLGAWDADRALEQGREWYADVVADATGVLSVSGARVIWMGWPPTRPPPVPGFPDPDYDRIEAGRDMVDNVFSMVAAARPRDVAFLSTGPPLELGGAFSAFLPDASGALVRARKHDNTHFCPAGAERMGRFVVAALTPVFDLPEADPSWASGAWRADDRFDEPPGACR